MEVWFSVVCFLAIVYCGSVSLFDLLSEGVFLLSFLVGWAGDKIGHVGARAIFEHLLSLLDDCQCLFVFFGV